ncbi:MAG: hypothetical protein AAGF95_26640 [Chloroflexota bacterium]
MLSPDTILQDRYQLLYPVDERPGGQVYRAQDTQKERPILLCALPLVDDEAREEMTLLARQLTTIQHKVLLPLLGHFVDGSSFYMVVEDPGGKDLEHILRGRGEPFAETDILPHLGQLLQMLEVLHQQRPPFFVGELWLSDLWVAEDESWRLAPHTLARPFVHLASPYRAPELTPDDADPNPATDTYAVSAMLYHALSGRAPTTVEQQQAGTALQPPRILNEQLSELVEQAILRGLQQRPVNRYQNVRELRLALETVQVMAGRITDHSEEILPANDPTQAKQEKTPSPAATIILPPEESVPAATRQPEAVPTAPPENKKPESISKSSSTSSETETQPPEEPKTPSMSTTIMQAPMLPGQTVETSIKSSVPIVDPDSANSTVILPENPSKQGISTRLLIGIVVVLATIVLCIGVGLIALIAGVIG